MNLLYYIFLHWKIDKVYKIFIRAHLLLFPLDNTLLRR
jgi:hypothetical protein